MTGLILGTATPFEHVYRSPIAGLAEQRTEGKRTNPVERMSGRGGDRLAVAGPCVGI